MKNVAEPTATSCETGLTVNAGGAVPIPVNATSKEGMSASLLVKRSSAFFTPVDPGLKATANAVLLPPAKVATTM
jgi:hypothetical protein